MSCRRTCAINPPPQSANAPQRLRRTSRLVRGVAVAALAAAFAAPTAAAADLIVLDGDPPLELSGNVAYGIVYVDGTLRLTGDTAITASQVYFGPTAVLETCFVPGVGASGCTNGRSLTISAVGSISIVPAITLTGAVAPNNGGSLALSGASIALGGAVTTTGNGVVSGSVTITSSGAVETQGITAPGAAVRIEGAGGVSVTGDLNTSAVVQIASGVQNQAPAGGPITLSSVNGDVNVVGNLLAGGLNVTAAAGPTAGAGGTITVNGGEVRVGAVDATGGTNVDQAGGPAAPIRLQARGALYALGSVDASGSSATNSAGSTGSSIELTAGGAAFVSSATVSGGSGPLGGGGAPAGTITVSAASVVVGNLSAFGGSATASAAPGNGGSGGAVKVQSAGPVSLGTISAGGGSAPPGGLGGVGGSVEVAGGSVSTGQVTTSGGATGGGIGMNGGAIRLLAESNLTVGGAVTSSGSSAVGSASPARAGGVAGPITLRAAGGTLTLAGVVRAEGGNGGPDAAAVRGGAGGQGGQIEVIARSLGSILGIFSEGGFGGGFGDSQGPGGNGGMIRAWSDAPLFDATKVVSSLGGDGIPIGSDGQQVQDSSPTGVAIDGTGALGFTSRSPDAQGYRVLRSVTGGPAEVIVETGATSGIRPPAPICTPVTFTVVAFNSAYGWTSDAPAAISYTAQPSATQTCSDPPRVTAKKLLRTKLKTLRRAKWQLPVRLLSSGIGTLDVQLLKNVVKKVVRKKQRETKATSQPLAPGTVLALTAPGAAVIKFPMPKKARKPGLYILRLVAISPDGKVKQQTKLTLEVLP